MPMLLQHVDLKPYNSFGIPAQARYFAAFTSRQGLQALMESSPAVTSKNILLLGGGSNLLFTKNFDGLVLKNEMSGIECVKENDENVWVKAMGGENWHGLVEHCVQNNWGGIENLALIPGSVGATPIQNIGAYGVELADVFEELEAHHLADGSLAHFRKQDCRFGYRDSIFKQSAGGQYAILSVTLRLSKKPVLHTSYGPIVQQLEAMQVSHPGISDVMKAVMQIRRSKLPDPAVTGNAGSFFKNPVVEEELATNLLKEWPGMPNFPDGRGQRKIPAAWLIEKAGWKGYRDGDAGVHPLQPLVLVNYGNADGQQIYDLSEKIRSSVIDAFGISLEREVNIL